jgi:hypothetical protein
MIRKVAILGFCLSSVACSAGTTLLKSPVDQQRRSLSLKECPELVDGILLYAEGDTVGAQEKLRRAGAANTEEDLQRFAQTLGAMTGVPGAAELAGPVTAMLLEAAQSGEDPAAPAKAKGASPASIGSEAVHEAAAQQEASQDRQDRAYRTGSLVDPMALRALSASVDPMRIETASVSLFSSGPWTGVECVDSWRLHRPLPDR